MSLNPVSPVTNRGVISQWLATEPTGVQLLAVDANGDVKYPTSAEVQAAADLPSALAAYATTAAVAAGYQPLDSDLTAIAALATTPFGRALLTLADAVAMRTTIGLGTADSPTFANVTSSGNVAAGAASGVWGGSLRVGGASLATANTFMFSQIDGVLQLYNSAVNNFNRLCFGGTTSAFPSLKRNGTTLESRLADDSAFAPFGCSNLTASGTVTVGTGTTDQFGTVKVSTSTNGYLFCGYDAAATNNLFWVGNARPTAATRSLIYGLSNASQVEGPATAAYLWALSDDIILQSYGSSRQVAIYNGRSGMGGSYAAQFGSTSISLLRDTSVTGALSVSSGFNLASRTKAAVLASSPATNAGMFRLSDSGLVGRVVYPDGTNWRYASDDSIVT